MVFYYEVSALRESGSIAAAVTQVYERLRKGDVPPGTLNSALDVLISAGEYEGALRAEPAPNVPNGKMHAASLALIQINLAEAEYNLGRWKPRKPD